MTRASDTVPFEAEARLIVQVALLVFVYTVVVGILNGTDAVDFGRKVLLAHVHGGTLGWITLSVMAASLWLFSPGPALGATEERWVRWLAYAAPAVIAAYVVAFFATTGVLRPILGAIVMIVIIGFAIWIARRSMRVPLSVPHLGFLAAVGTSMFGAVLGVLLGYAIAIGADWLPEGVAGAHPGTMVVGFLVPAGMAMVEWALDPASVTRRATRAGVLQIALPFAGGLLLMVGLILDITPLAALNLPFEVAGVIIFIVRMFPAARRVNLMDVSPARHALLAGIYLVFNIGFLAYMISNYIDDFSKAPVHLVLVLDHSIFVGVMTNAILAFVVVASRAQRPAWVDHAVFWGVNVGITGFIAGLLLDSAPIKRMFTPILGLALLLAIAAHTYTLRAGAGERSNLAGRA